MKRLLLTLVTGPVLWYLGHVLTASIWTLARLPPESPVPRITNLALIPLAFVLAWVLLTWARPEPPASASEEP